MAYYYGEDSNVTALFAAKAPNVPRGYNYDFINADTLVTALSVKDGAIITPSGMHYRVLALDPNALHMSLPVLRRLTELVAAGAVVVGDRPTDTPAWPMILKSSAARSWHCGAKATAGMQLARARCIPGRH